MFSLDGKVVVVVGAGSSAPGWSNGRAAAVSYARSGASVLCVDRRADLAEQTAALIYEEGGVAEAFPADSTSEADVDRVMARSVERFGRLDVVHNNVGAGGVNGPPDEVTPDQWDQEIAVNLTTAYLGIRCSVPVLRRFGGGVITNISSVVAVRFLRAPSVAYTAAKAGVEAMTRACSIAYGADDIRVNCIRIGFAETPLIVHGMAAAGLTQEQADVEMAKARRKIPLGRHTSPFDVGAAAVFLASDEAHNITGVVLNVDGGLENAPI